MEEFSGEVIATFLRDWTASLDQVHGCQWGYIKNGEQLSYFSNSFWEAENFLIGSRKSLFAYFKF